MEIFETREDAARAAAERISAALARRLEAQQAATFVASGGTTPLGCYEVLTAIDIDWPNVHVVPSDERWVPPTDADSNERMIRETLLKGRAADASLLGVYSESTEVGDRLDELETELRLRPFPFACALLGMGTDGHFASLFPDAERLEEGLDPESQSLWLEVRTAASPHPRVSLTLSALSRSDEILLLIFGDEKREVLEEASQVVGRYPVSRLLLQKRAPITVYWAP